MHVGSDTRHTTCRVLRERARFKPAIGSDRAPTPAKLVQTVDWAAATLQGADQSLGISCCPTAPLLCPNPADASAIVGSPLEHPRKEDRALQSPRAQAE